MTDQALIDVLSARSGLVCVVGAGGKKTTLYRLAAAHPGRVGVTSTVFIPNFPETLEAHRVIADEEHLVSAVTEAATTARTVAFVLPSTKHGRLGGVPPTLINTIHEAARFDVTFIKADGARTRWIKAPEDDEPQIPEGATTVIPVVSARAIGEPLTEQIAHRVERVTEVTGARPGEVITPTHVARLLASEKGSLKGAGQAAIVPLINMVDGPERETRARQAAEEALALSPRFDRVVLAAMRRSDPLVAVVKR
jgi:probable selenium-dependent hydroxylase accessory protein YqeC